MKVRPAVVVVGLQRPLYWGKLAHEAFAYNISSRFITSEWKWLYVWSTH